MKVMINLVSKILGRLARDEEGASGVEYAILAAVIGAALFSGSNLIAGSIGTAFTTISEQIVPAE
ncbi:MAG: Flp/Fap pilin component [Rhizorhabdus sp.]|nr:Flp/Fap pilin component [Rhizorhabdus sp.]